MFIFLRKKYIGFLFFCEFFFSRGGIFQKNIVFQEVRLGAKKFEGEGFVWLRFKFLCTELRLELRRSPSLIAVTILWA